VGVGGAYRGTTTEAWTPITRTALPPVTETMALKGRRRLRRRPRPRRCGGELACSSHGRGWFRTTDLSRRLLPDSSARFHAATSSLPQVDPEWPGCRTFPKSYWALRSFCDPVRLAGVLRVLRGSSRGAFSEVVDEPINAAVSGIVGSLAGSGGSADAPPPRAPGRTGPVYGAGASEGPAARVGAYSRSSCMRLA
jgi:hypothetical protein